MPTSETSRYRKPLTHNLELFRTAIETIASAVFIFQGDHICYVNPCAEQLTGYNQKELLGMSFWATVHDDFQYIVKTRGRARQTGKKVPKSYEVKLRRKNGEIRWVKLRLNTINLQDKPAVIGIAEDVTEQKTTEERLQLISELSQKATGEDFFVYWSHPWPKRWL